MLKKFENKRLNSGHTMRFNQERILRKGKDPAKHECEQIGEKEKRRRDEEYEVTNG